MVNAIDEANAHCPFRSSIGQYAAELPGRFIVCSIYSFLLSFMLFFFLLLLRSVVGNRFTQDPQLSICTYIMYNTRGPSFDKVHKLVTV
jgi:hypothetical protein